MSDLPEDPQCPLFDPQRLMQVTDGDRELIDVVLVNFTTDIRHQFQQLQECCRTDDVGRQYVALHKMKGSLGNVGAKQLQRLLADCCDQTRLDGRALSSEDLQRIERELSQTLDCIAGTDWTTV